jgi:DNA-binding NarL/FixJ family response regulator
VSGIDLRNQLATEGVVTPVIFVTAHDDPKAREAAMAGRCAGYFRKTDSGSELLDAIRHAVSPPAPG